jgi:hypothetical protein
MAGLPRRVAPREDEVSRLCEHWCEAIQAFATNYYLLLLGEANQVLGIS